MSQPAAPNPTDLHDDQVIALLRSGAHRALLSAYFGESEYRELCTLAKLSATRQNPDGQLVFVLPGIMGSRLGSVRNGASSLLWLHPTAVAHGALLQLALPGQHPLHAIGVMLPGYLKLRLSLEIAGFRPRFHPFDWRCDLERTAREFLQAVRTCGAPKIHVVAHSMGGLVARIALGADNEGRIDRLVQLGAPNHGSFAPVQALRAVYPTVRKIAALDLAHTAEDLARQVFRTLPGLYQLLPSMEDRAEPDLFDASSWPDDGLTPDPELLEHARGVRARMLPADPRCFVIAGACQETITSVAMRDGVFEYALACDGDGTVPASRVRWDGAATWFAEENHGALTNSNVVLGAVVDILKTGDTARLPATQPRSTHRTLRRVTDHELRALATRKVPWDSLSLDSRRRILEPVISPEFQGQ